MLARIAEELFWLGRYLSRAEHTARMLDGLFHLNLQTRAGDEPAGLSWDALLAIMGARLPDGEQPTAEAVLARLTVDASIPGSVRSCVVRGRSRAVTVRDVMSREMWEAVNSFYLQIIDPQLEVVARNGPYAVYQLTKDRCAAFWGLAGQTMLRDEGYAFLAAGDRLESAHMVLRMLRVALPDVHAGGASGLTRSQLDGRALALLHAVGGTHAYRRAVRRPADAEPVARFLLFDREYPEAVAAALGMLAALLEGADPDDRQSAPLLRLERLGAELEFRRREAGGADLPPMFTQVQDELDRVDAEIARRYFLAVPTGPALVVT
jgi:uncharacterized alpha-E superfamily protein